ncbi:hypothetical protein [Streptomyces sp. NPDC002990]
MGRVRRVVAGAVVGAAALGLTAGLPGAAYADGSAPEPIPAYRAADGARKIEGKRSTADAPLLEAGALYTDTLAPGERAYRLYLDDKSTVYVSAVLQPPTGARVGYGDGIEVKVMTTEGRDCPHDSGQASFAYDAVPLSEVGVRLRAEDAECQQAGTYYAKVTRRAGKSSDQSPWPVELRLQREPALAPGSEPTAAPSAWASEPPTLPGTEPVVRSGGTGFNDARAVGSGVWRDELRPGQTRFYRVPLDWGQQLGLSAELAAAKLTKTYGSASNGLTVSLYTPYRGLVVSQDASYDGKQAAVTLPKTAPVAYENRFSDNTKMRAVRVAGWYYIAVTMGGKVGEFIEDATPVPLTLRMDVIGSPGREPGYKESPAAAGFGVGAEDRAAAKEGLTAPEAAEAAEGRSVMRVVAGAGFGTGTLLLLGLGAWTLLARRASASAGA